MQDIIDRFIETNLCLENNTNIWTLWKRFDKIQHKKRKKTVNSKKQKKNWANYW